MPRFVLLIFLEKAAGQASQEAWLPGAIPSGAKPGPLSLRQQRSQARPSALTAISLALGLLSCSRSPLAAGILQEQAPAVVEAYSPWFEGFAVEAEDRWALVTARRRTEGGSQ